MTPERHERICELVYQALELDAEARDSFLRRACSSDPSLRREVEALLLSGEDARSSFLKSASFQPTLRPGVELGDYQVEALLGSGGMGEVYVARDLRLARQVAIKVLQSYLASDPERLRRFQQEARAAAALNHPNILAVFQLGEHRGAPYLVSELLEGQTLRQRIQSGPIPFREAIDLAVQIARGLAAAHEKGLVHRDLKPENLFVTTDGRMKILDFGLAKLIQPNRKEELVTQTGVVMGTVGYMSPEQTRGQVADARSDIFALGVVLYEMLSGERAFRRDTAADTMSSILNENPRPLSKLVPNLPGALQRAVQRCLEKNPDNRFQRASDVVSELESLAAARRPSGANLFWAAALAGLLAAVVISQKDVLEGFARRLLHLRSPAASVQPLLIERKLTANLPDNPVSAAAISRDGKYVAYTDNSKKVHLLLVDSGDVRSLSLDSSYVPLDWFPDGLHLLLAPINGQPGFWKFSTWDSQLRKLWEGPLDSTGSGRVRNTAVSPDGSRIAFIEGADLREIWLMGAEGEDPHRIAEFSAQDTLANLAWSPGGGRLAYVHVRGTFAKHESVIETCDLAGKSRSVVLSEPMLWGPDGIAGLAWLADGRVVYSIFAKTNEYNLWSLKVNPGGTQPAGKPEPLTDWKDFAAPSLQSTGDGKGILAIKSHSKDEIYLETLTPQYRGLNIKRLIADDWRNVGKAWTQDSKSILLFSKRNGRLAIYRRSLSSDTPQSVIAGPENYRDPVPSVSGFLLYNAFAPEDIEDPAKWRLMSTPIGGGPRSQLMTGRHTYDCASSGSAPCVVADLEDNQLAFFTLDPVKGRGAEIARVPNRVADLPEWSLSRDGSKIAMVETGEESNKIKILSLPDRAITSLPVQGSKWKYLTAVCWAADGKHLFAIGESESSSALIAIDPAGRLAVLQEVDPAQAWLGLPIASPDGRFLAFTKRTYVSDLTLETF
jgi:eukaryotic-like serine/threonine-protein kinase